MFKGQLMLLWHRNAGELGKRPDADITKPGTLILLLNQIRGLISFDHTISVSGELGGGAIA
jgi:hypothetical protein